MERKRAPRVNHGAATVFADEGKQVAKSVALTVRFPPDVEAYIISQPNRSEWVRKAARMLMELESSDSDPS